MRRTTVDAIRAHPEFLGRDLPVWGTATAMLFILLGMQFVWFWAILKCGKRAGAVGKLCCTPA
jgi:hypothetical protein